MSEKYIPTTDEVRSHYDPSCEPRFQDDDRLEEHIPAEFDRWLAAHDARIRREALELSGEEMDDICRLMLNKSSERACRSCLRGALATVAKHREVSDVLPR